MRLIFSRAPSARRFKLNAWINQGATVMTDKGLVSFLELYQARKSQRNPDDMALIQRTLKRVR